MTKHSAKMMTLAVARLVKRGHKLSFCCNEGERTSHRQHLELDSDWEEYTVFSTMKGTIHIQLGEYKQNQNNT